MYIYILHIYICIYFQKAKKYILFFFSKQLRWVDTSLQKVFFFALIDTLKWPPGPMVGNMYVQVNLFKFAAN